MTTIVNTAARLVKVGIVMGLTIIALPTSAAPRIYATGVTRYVPAKAYPCYVLFAGADGKTHLIDMDGNEVHRWPQMGFPSKMLSPKLTGGKRGRLLVQLQSMKGTHAPGKRDFNNIFHDKTIGEVDWNGKVLWSWGLQAPGGAAHQNHDYERLANGNTLVLTAFDHHIPGFKAKETADQAIDEVTSGGKIVWRWVAGDHVNEFGFTKKGLKMIRNGFSIDRSGEPGHTGFLTINAVSTLGPNHWYEQGDKRFNPNNIMINSREADFVAIIDKATGKVVWHLGPVYPDTGKPPEGRVANLTLPRPVDQMSGEHFAHLIPEGLPGAGDILLLDNQGSGGIPPAYVESLGASRVLEINPVKKEIVWQYNGESSGRALWSFYTAFMGSVQRLPNGNTLIDEAVFGHVFQVTPDGKVVWDYVSPYFGHGRFGGTRDVASNYLYRVQAVPYDWVPAGTPHSEREIRSPDVSTFRVPGAP